MNDIQYKFSDTYSSKVFYGYRTIFTYLFELDKGNITDASHVDKKLTWFLKCGSFSYAEIPNDFFAIMGVTGTLNSLSEKEHDVMQNSYGVCKQYIFIHYVASIDNAQLIDKHIDKQTRFGNI